MQNLAVLDEEVCFNYDGFLQDKDEAVWIVYLNNGTQVFCDDGRYGEEDRAWTRLREYLRVTEFLIEKILVKFRSHTELAAQRTPNTIGWYFGRAAGAWVGQPTSNYMVIGTVERVNDEAVVKTTKWRVPEVIKDESDERDPNDYPLNIIWEPGYGKE